MKIILHCPEGFLYSGWQRIVATLDGLNISKALAEVSNAAWRADESVDHLLCPSELAGVKCFFVLGGESFTIQDLAEAIGGVIALEIVCADGTQGVN